MPPSSRTRRTRDFFDLYTRGFSSADFQRLVTQDAADAVQFFARHIDDSAYRELPPVKRFLVRTRLVFLAFTLKLSPARRVLFGIALLMAVIGLVELFEGIGPFQVPILVFIGLPGPTWAEGTLWLLGGFVLVNLLVLLEVADRLSLKNDLEVARDVQRAMLPHGTFRTSGMEAAGETRPANTVGGDLYDILPLPDGRVMVVIGDVAGKGSPAALLMALVIAMLRTLAQEGLPLDELMTKLNVLVYRQTPGSRFITMFVAILDPRTGDLTFVNAGQNPPLLLSGGKHTTLATGGMALGMFDKATYGVDVAVMEPSDLLVMYSDGITEAENPAGVPFDESGLTQYLRRLLSAPIADFGPRVIGEVARYVGRTKFADDLTVLCVRRVEPGPEPIPTQGF